jgi:hypothetical protein
MAIGTRRIKRYRTDRDKPVEAHHKKPEPEEDDLDSAREKFNKAKETYIQALRDKRSPHKTTNREELTSAGKTILKGAGSMVDDFLDGSSRIGRSVERDIRRHSIQGQIDNTLIRALMEKNKGSRGKGTTKRPKIYVEVKGADGRPVLVDIKDIPSALRKRGR